ncbi:magnesium transporter CorA family protein [Pseudogemmobacter blasticus]|uniref:Magnesium transport protein CorA n=1 Tax=Fuscovulum blasticum DSM 2131 TaxID=1188250 RepID=A0A2T4JD81_FUSBL|nr:magnesium transporter CorA family protein [Fuscovulum blasticum]PTE15849.1 magnesium transporter [Fuscovulum blasticum DSM 2131]
MLFAYASAGAKLTQMPHSGPLDPAVWVDLYKPMPAQVERVRAMGLEVPTPAEMEEIELSNRLYREGGADYMTVVLPGLDETGARVSAPVTFILTATRLITVRHHRPRPFETYPTRADKVGPGCTDPRRLFLSLMEEIIGRLADILEAGGGELDQITARVFDLGGSDRNLAGALREISQMSDQIAKVRLSLLTLERAISYFGQSLADGGGDGLRPVVKGLMRDIQALEVHGDFLTNRIAMASDLSLGMISVAQNTTVKIVSVVAVIFLPPTLIASAYGMNFTGIPELTWAWGYQMALGLMLASAVGTFLFFKWKRWL